MPPSNEMKTDICLKGGSWRKREKERRREGKEGDTRI